ncbi:aldose epimerase family protein [Maribacter litoralis]|uniref:Aldose 1-epimerase n=1 Tax=Maribacter litoralis TaxID=2059726 RepID=A0A653U6P5_9FLAO|nr:aldose epimerase family protein [Maribacter litoralis]VXB88478.1 Aldose 1-epimerase [Maribacter litoralis]
MKLMNISLFSGVIFAFLIIYLGSKENTVNYKVQNEKSVMGIERSSYGVTENDEKIDVFKLYNLKGIQVSIITYGGRITAVETPDKNGNKENVVLGFKNLEQYEKPNPYFGALVGRYGNRIAKGKFTLNNIEYQLAKNNGENSLHGGLVGFDKVVWKVEKIEENETSVVLKLSYLSKDMEEGFPGNLKTTVTYTLNYDNSLDVLYEATTDKTTILNLTQHSYFNLSGDFSHTILDHVVEINADKFVPVDNTLIPTGNLASVDDTPFDFRAPTLVGKHINSKNEQVTLGGGYDHCWVLNNQGKGYRSVAKAYHPDSGRTMEVLTDQPGMQFYTGNFLDGTLPTPNGGVFGKRSGFCFETQHYPDSPNQPQFPSTVLDPGEKYETKTTFKFSVN